MTDQELQRELAKMLPEKIRSTGIGPYEFHWLCSGDAPLSESIVRETEWLDICQRIEKRLTYTDRVIFVSKFKAQSALGSMLDLQKASWQQRARALIAVKGEK